MSAATDITHGPITFAGQGEKATIAMTSKQGDATVTSEIPLGQTRGHMLDIPRLRSMNTAKLEASANG